MAISLDQIKELRSRTGVGVVDAKEALSSSNGDMDKAIAWLREQGKAKAAKKADRATHEGAVGVYVHGNNKLAVMVSLLCETDFVARNEKFQELARGIAMHIAAMDPLVVSPDDVPESELASERELAQKQVADKPAQMQEKIIEGKLKKFREERALLTQPYVKDPKKTVQDMLNGAVHELGENVTIKEFTRVTI
ncbi:MAG: translation elongation factor Ts [Candidatus Andersenbacteria bacterium]